LRTLCVIVSALFLASPLTAQTVAELQAQLDAQIEINALLKQRIKSLEAQRAAETESHGPTNSPLPVVAAPVAVTHIDPEGDGALEQALVRRGSAVLAPGVIEVTPSVSWAHSGRDVLRTTDDFFSTSLDARIGLKHEWMVGAGTSLAHRRINGIGTNSGIGDSGFAVWKQIATGDGNSPSVVASVRYGAPTGEDFGDTIVPLGSGFHQITARLSVVKTIAPFAFFGDAAYRYSFPERFSGVKFERSGVFGLGLGASLAVNPDISASAALRFEFEEEVKRNETSIPGSSTTTGIVELGLGVVLRKNVFMNINAGFGITDDAPDTSVSVSFPLRF
jgi:hypothetical protein